MNNLKLSLRSAAAFRPYILIDGEEQKLKKNQFSSYDVFYQTEKEEVTVEIFKPHELNGVLWLLMAFIFNIVSLFGLLDPWYDGKCFNFSVKFTVKLKESTNVNLYFPNFIDGNKAVQFTTESQLTEVENVCFLDKKLQKRVKTVRAIKIISWVLLIGAIICLFVI